MSRTLSLALLLLSSPLWLSSPELAMAVDVAAIDARVEEALLEEAFSGAVLGSVGEQVIYERYVGNGQVSEDAPISEASLWPVASSTKSFTAILVFQLIEAWKLRVDETIADILPDLKAQRAKSVTVRHLLNHTSGLPLEREVAYQSQRTPIDWVGDYGNGLVRRGKLGEFRYNNLDYWVLGLIVEARGGIKS